MSERNCDILVDVKDGGLSFRRDLYCEKIVRTGGRKKRDHYWDRYRLNFIFATRMHSSRMRPSAGEGGCLLGGGGLVPDGSVPTSGGSWGACVTGSGPGGCALSQDGGILACTEAEPPLPPVDRQTGEKHSLRNFVADGNNRYKKEGSLVQLEGSVVKLSDSTIIITETTTYPCGVN